MATTQTKQRGISRQVVSTKLDERLLSSVDQFADSVGLTRSAALAQLIGRGLGDQGSMEDLVRENVALRTKLAEVRDVLR